MKLKNKVSVALAGAMLLQAFGVLIGLGINSKADMNPTLTIMSNAPGGGVYEIKKTNAVGDDGKLGDAVNQVLTSVTVNTPAETKFSGTYSGANLKNSRLSITQTKRMPGFLKDTKSASVEFPKMDDTGNIVGDQSYTITTKNTPLVKDYSFVKYKGNGTEPLSGAEFEIKRLKKPSTIGDNNAVATWVDANDTVSTQTSADTTGQVTFRDLPEGQYEIRETRAPQGYVTSPRKITFTVTLDNNTNTAVIANNSITSDDVYKNFTEPGIDKKIVKYSGDEVDKTTYDVGNHFDYKISLRVPADIRSYTEFKVTDTIKPEIILGKANLEAKGVRLYRTDSENDGVKISVNGLADGLRMNFTADTGRESTFELDMTNHIQDLVPDSTIDILIPAFVGSGVDGKYTDNDGYIPNTARLTYNNGGGIIHKDSPKADVKPVVGQVILTKTNSDKTKQLKGVVFDLYKKVNMDMVGATAVGTVEIDGSHYTKVKNVMDGSEYTGLTTNDSGMISVTNLAYGEYAFVETKTVKGYRLPSKPFKFTIGERESNVSVDALNYEIGEIEVDTGTIGMLVAVIAIGGLLGFAWIRENRKAER